MQNPIMAAALGGEQGLPMRDRLRTPRREIQLLQEGRVLSKD